MSAESDPGLVDTKSNPFTLTPALMPDPCTSESQGTPTRNFSHPFIQRAPVFSADQDNEYYQDNPPMAPNDSRHNLPLNSRNFSRSTSDLRLNPDISLAAGFDFSDHSPRRPGTSYTLTSRSVNDITLTALPQNQPPVPSIPQQYGAPQINPPSPKRLIKSPQQSPTKSAKSAKSKKGGTWRTLGRKVKKVFNFGRNKKRSSREMETKRQSLQISSPYGFQHNETGGIGDLRIVAPHTVGVGATTAGGVIGQYAGPSTQSGAGLGGRSDAGRGGVIDGLGWKEEDGTAVDDDGNSD